MNYNIRYTVYGILPALMIPDELPAVLSLAATRMYWPCIGKDRQEQEVRGRREKREKDRIGRSNRGEGSGKAEVSDNT